MNNLKTSEVGGMPIVLDDLRFLHQSYLEAIKGMSAPFGIAATDVVIMSGMVRSVVGANIEYTEGYVLFGGEIFHSPAQTYADIVGAENEYIVVDVAYDAAGLKVFENTNEYDTYEIRKVKMVKSETLPSGGVILADIKQFYNVIRTNIDTERTGVVKDFAGDTIPSGYLLCDGSAVSRTTYAALFSVIGTLWGVGDGSTTFNLPNINGRVSVGFDAAEADYNTVGKIGGEKEHILTANESGMPGHYIHWAGSSVPSTVHPGVLMGANQDPQTFGVSGVNASQAHENRQPFAVFKKIIRI